MAKAKKRKSAKKKAKKKAVKPLARRTARKTKSAAKKAKRPAKAKKAVKARKASKRPAAKKARKSKDVIGEGNYTAAREFRRDEEAFVRDNRRRIPQMGRDAEAAREGPEGDALRRAEDEARSHARD
jgi:hypothetical protein